MEGDFGSEIGKKMRSAVKAKLLELGTGNSTGYIDDELPDYVMIMVANKRSKEQMSTDLELFLGAQTELFVTWLHEVLQKLNEVTLMVPTHSVSTKKRKSLQKEEVPQKKDKKSNKNAKDKSKSSKKPEEKSASTATAKKPATAVPAIPSITDVFAEDLLKKAQKNYDFATDAAESIKKGKAKKTAEAPSTSTAGKTKASATSTSHQQADDELQDFDTPTITDLSTLTASSRDKDLAELADLQEKIYAAKKHLKELAENQSDLDAASVEDEDFLNLKDDGLNAELNDEQEPPAGKNIAKPKSPIVFGRQEQVQAPQEQKTAATARLSREPSLSLSPTPSPPPKATTPEHHAPRSKDILPPPATRHSRERERDRVEPAGGDPKRPVHERLGLRQQGREPAKDTRRVRQEKELYVPAFRRKEMERKRERTPDRERQRERDRSRDYDKDRNRERERERDRDRDRERERDRERDDRGRERDRLNRNERPRVRSRTGDRSSNGGTTPPPPPPPPTRNQSKKESSATGDEVQRHRIGSRVIVAPVKPVEPSDDEDLMLSVNSVVKIKPRPIVSPSKQACKNLLLRAVAEAQRSTTLAKPKPKPPSKETAVVKTINRSTKLYTKSYRDRIKRGAIEVTTAGAGGELFKRSAQQLVVEVDRDRGGRAAVKGNRRRQVSPTMVVENDDEEEDNEYVPDMASERGESDSDYVYIAQPIQQPEEEYYEENSAENSIEDEDELDLHEADKPGVTKTQFVVTLNEEKTPSKYKKALSVRTRSANQAAAPPERMRQNGNASPKSAHLSRSRIRDPPRSKQQDPKAVAQVKSSMSPSLAKRLSERESSNSSPSGSTASQQRRSDLIAIYRKPKDVKKIIIKNDTDDDEYSPQKPTASKQSENGAVDKSRTPPLPAAMSKKVNQEERKRTTNIKRETRSRTRSRSPLKSKRTPIKFDLDRKLEQSNDRSPSVRRRSRGADERNSDRERERDRGRDLSVDRPSGEDRKRISIRNNEAKKYDNIPSLNSVAIDGGGGIKVVKPKERCKYHPNCTKQFCDFYHPSAPCKAFPNCKYADKCMYSHPKCKYDLACTNIDCNYSHTGPRNTSLLQPTAPPLSSHVVPVQNYKSISATTPSVSSTMCKYYPNCTKVACPFFHPKPCRFGKNCINKLECNFYHAELQSSNKFKWVASIV